MILSKYSLLLEASRYDPLDRIVSKAWIFGAFVIGTSLVVIEATAPDQVECFTPSNQTTA